MSTNNSVNFGNLPAVTVATDDKVVISDASDSGLMKTCTTQSIGDLAASPNVKALWCCTQYGGIISSYNVSSVTGAANNNIFNFTTALDSANYGICGWYDDGLLSGVGLVIDSTGVSSCSVYTEYLSDISGMMIAGVRTP